MRRRIPYLPLAFALVNASCGGASSDNLRGWWITTTDDQSTIFGFLPREDAANEIPFDFMSVTGDVSVVYQKPPFLDVNLVQVATYTVEGGALQQTVVGDVGALPGTMFSTQILDFSTGESLTLESKNDASGARTYKYSPRCPADGPLGWHQVRGAACPSYFTGGSSLTIDDEGGVHVVAGVAGGGVEDPNCVPVPTYAHLGDGCESIPFTIPAFLLSSTLLVGDEIHVLTQNGNYELEHVYRKRDASEWTIEKVAPTPMTGTSARELRLFSGPDGLTAVAGRTDGILERYVKKGTKWTAVPMEVSPGQPAVGPIVDAAMNEAGEIAILVENQQVAHVTKSGVKLIDLPKPLRAGFGGGVRFDAKGRIHTVWDYQEIGTSPGGVGGQVIDLRAVYGIYDGAKWKTFEIGPAAYPLLITRPDGPMRVVHADAKAAVPGLILLEVGEDGSLRSERMDVATAFGGGGSPEPFIRMAAAEGPDGTIAALFNGQKVWVKHPVSVLPRSTMPIHIKINGTGHVKSKDGRVDCKADCTVNIPWGERVALEFDPKPTLLSPYDNRYDVYGWLWVDTLPVDMLGGAINQVDVTVTF